MRITNLSKFVSIILFQLQSPFNNRCTKYVGVPVSGKRLFVQKTLEARDGFQERQGWIHAFF